jgi:hypothetical protein
MFADEEGPPGCQGPRLTASSRRWRLMEGPDLLAPQHGVAWRSLSRRNRRQARPGKPPSTRSLSRLLRPLWIFCSGISRDGLCPGCPAPRQPPGHGGARPGGRRLPRPRGLRLRGSRRRRPLGGVAVGGLPGRAARMRPPGVLGSAPQGGIGRKDHSEATDDRFVPGWPLTSVSRAPDTYAQRPRRSPGSRNRPCRWDRAAAEREMVARPPKSNFLIWNGRSRRKICSLFPL